MSQTNASILSLEHMYPLGNINEYEHYFKPCKNWYM